MELAYLPYLMLLAASPILGMYSLKFAYPEVKTYIRFKKSAIFIVFGLLAYVPAAGIALGEVLVPLYSPFGPAPMFSEYEGNVAFAAVLFLGLIVINSSLVDYAVARRKKNTIVGIPKHVIKYSIDREIVKGKETQRKKDIVRITNDIEVITKEDKDVKPLLEKIKLSVEKDRAADDERAAMLVAQMTGIGSDGWMADLKAKGEIEGREKRVLLAAKELDEEMIRGIKLEEVKNIEQPKERAGGEKIIVERIKHVETPLAEAPVVKAQSKAFPQVPLEAAEKKPAEWPAAEKPAANLKDRDALLAELEKKLKGSQSAASPDKSQKTNELLNELKETLREEKASNAPLGGAYEVSDIEEITNALRTMKKEEEEKSERRGGRRGKAEEPGPEEEIGTSLSGREHGGYSRSRGGDDVMRNLVGDVRQQLGGAEARSGRKAEEKPGGKRWYDGMEEAPKAEGVPREPSVDLFAGDLSGGEETLGEFGSDLGGDLGGDLSSEFGLSSLESVNDNLESSGFDGMFVDVGGGKGGCPNCGKKGTSIVYCSNCGKPLCSNCAKSVEGSEDYIKYKCPHCNEEFAMKRRMQA